MIKYIILYCLLATAFHYSGIWKWLYKSITFKSRLKKELKHVDNLNNILRRDYWLDKYIIDKDNLSWYDRMTSKIIMEKYIDGSI